MGRREDEGIAGISSEGVSRLQGTWRQHNPRTLPLSAPRMEETPWVFAASGRAEKGSVRIRSSQVLLSLKSPLLLPVRSAPLGTALRVLFLNNTSIFLCRPAVSRRKGSRKFTNALLLRSRWKPA